MPRGGKRRSRRKQAAALVATGNEADLKAAGNASFREKRYEQAIDFYSAAIKTNPSNHLLYSNRSAAYAARGKVWQKQAQADAETSIACAAKQGLPFSKGWYRKVVALELASGTADSALEAMEQLCRLDPDSAVFQKKLKNMRTRAVRKREAKTWRQQDLFTHFDERSSAVAGKGLFACGNFAAGTVLFEIAVTSTVAYATAAQRLGRCNASLVPPWLQLLLLQRPDGPQEVVVDQAWQTFLRASTARAHIKTETLEATCSG